MTAVPIWGGVLADEYAKLDNRVRVFHQKNAGLSAARNTGLNHMSGEFIVFIDSDDDVETDMIEELHRLLCEEEADAVIGGYYGYGLKGKVRWSVIPQGVKTRSGKEMLCLADSTIPRGLVWGKLYRKELWQELRFPEGQLYEDSWTMPHVYSLAKKVSTYPRAIYHYYENPKSIMHTSKTIKQVCDSLNVSQHLAAFYEQEGMKKQSFGCMYEYIMQYISNEKSYDMDKRYKEKYQEYCSKYFFTPSPKRLKNKLRIIRAMLQRRRE